MFDGSKDSLGKISGKGDFSNFGHKLNQKSFSCASPSQ